MGRQSRYAPQGLYITPFPVLAPPSWVGFLNAHPDSAVSMWPVYSHVTKYVQAFKDWILTAGYDCCPDLRKMKPLSRNDFRDRYAAMQKDAKALQDGMIGALDERRSDAIKAILTARGPDTEAAKAISKGADIPAPPVELRILRAGGGRHGLCVHIPQADDPKFWLSVVFGAMLLSWEGDQSPARRCDHCKKFFIPYKPAPGQRFDSPSCKSTYHTRERRLSLHES